MPQSEIAYCHLYTVGLKMAETSKESAAPASKLANIDEVIESERAELKERRKDKAEVKDFPGFGATTLDKKNSIRDTVGLGLSGGGVRSAAFCLGALQALKLSGALDRVDYLSTVSGGGYIGSSFSGAMTESKGEIFPFESDLRNGESPGVQHIRDYSNYLIPHGVSDVLQSIGIYLRGIAANVLLVVPWLLFAAALTVSLHPDRGSLRMGAQLKLPLVGAYQPESFLFTWVLCLLFPIFLTAWALWRSAKRHIDKPEVPGALTRFFAIYIVVVGLVAFCELQPFAIDSLLDLETSGADAVPSAAHIGIGPALARWIHYAAVALTPVAAAFGFLGNKLGWLVKGVTESASVRKQALSYGIKAAMMVSALALPLVLWVVYLQFCYWAIQKTGWQPLFLVGLPLAIASWLLSPNANSLHRLYRDRLSKAFLFAPKDHVGPHDPIDPLRHTPLSTLAHGPYHLINTALNIQASKYANRRGRNADFFVFSPNYVGSQTTGYVRTKSMEAKAPEVDLATAMAVSGAAASSNMGSSSIKQWTPSLALLNVRLGYWMRNPRHLLGRSRIAETLHYLFNPYFLYEMFGQLNERRWYINLSDGGHIENLGAYELLRRRCCLIILVDAEADPDMNFDSFVTLQRYALIDLGVRIELPWREIRDATRETADKIAETGGPGERIEVRGPHSAYGKIYYPGTNGHVIEGRLLYVKASLTGDESDYVIDYKRRYPSFPHQTTGDQFFSEEQFEAYRNLGFHAMQGVFSGRDKIATTANQQVGAATAGVQETPAAPTTGGPPAVDPLAEMQPILKFRQPAVLPTIRAKAAP